MKLALDLGTRYTSAAWTTAGSPDLLPLRDNNSPFLENLLLWRNQKVVAVDDQARSQLTQESILLQSFKPDLIRHRLRWTDGIAARGHSELRHATSIGSMPVPKEKCPDGYTGPFYRFGLIKAIGGLLRHLWADLRKRDPGLDACDSLLVGVPYAFHEFSRRRLLHALKEGLADDLFPEPEFYQRALQSVSFVHETFAVLAAADYLYGGRLVEELGQKRPDNTMVIDIGAGFCTAALYQTQAGRDDISLLPGRMLGERHTQFAGDVVDAAMLDGVRGLDPDLDVFISNRYPDPAFRLVLMDAIRRAKIQLCDPAVGEISMQVPEADYVAIPRDAFTEWVRPVARRAADAAVEAAAEAGLSPSEVGAVLMVGGTSLIPEVRRAISDEFTKCPVIAPDQPADVQDALGAVTRGLARFEHVAEPVGMRPGNRRIGLYNTSWAPQEQFPPTSEQFVLLYDPLKPDEQKHKDFWWGFLHVPPGFGKLTVTLFESVDREEHLFTLYGIPVDDSNLTVPERFQVYIDVTGGRIFPRIWVWDVTSRRFLVKAFDLAKQSETRLTAWIEGEAAAYSYFDGDIFDGRPEVGMGWIPAVKRPAVGDVVRVVSGDRGNADWVNGGGPDQNGRVPANTIRGIWPRGLSAPTGRGLSECRNWHISEFLLKLDDGEPTNFQNLFIQHVPDGHRDGQMLVVETEHKLTPLASRNAEDALANQMGTMPTGAARTATNTTSGRMSRAPRLAPDGGDSVARPSGRAPSLSSMSGSGGGDDPFGAAGAMFESETMPTVFDTGQTPSDTIFSPPGTTEPPKSEADVPTAPPASSDPFGGVDTDGPVADGSVVTRSWTSAHAAWAGANAELPADAPDSWAESSAAGTSSSGSNADLVLTVPDPEMGEVRRTSGRLPVANVMKALRDSGVPTDRAEARAMLHRLMRQMVDGQVPADQANAAASIIRALFMLGHGEE